MKRLKPIFWIGILLFGWSGLSTELISQGVWKTYTTDDGLLASRIRDITQDKQGNYWVATGNGVCWMDRNETWHSLIDSTCFDSTMYFKNDILIDHQNNKWFIGQSMLRPLEEYVVRYDGTGFTYFDISWPIAGEKHYMCFGLDANHYVWVGTTEEYAFWYDGLQWHPFYVPGTIYWDPIFDFQLDKNGRFYIAHENGISTSEGNFLWDGRGTGNPVFDLALDNNNNLWFTGYVVGKYDGQTWQIFDKNDDLADYATFITVDSNNNSYIIFQRPGPLNWVSKFNGISWSHVQIPGHPSNDYLTRIYSDQKGAIWIGANQKIYVLTDTTTTKIQNLQINSVMPQKHFDLFPNYPNPFNQQTIISYSTNNSQFTTLLIIGVTGKEVIKLVNSYQTSGYYHILWNGTNQAGQDVSSGVYYAVLRGSSAIQTIKMCLIR